jgi:trk system potassium uptake protein TrkA
VKQLRDLGVPMIVAKAVTPLHGRILEKIGVSRVIFPEREMAIRVAHGLVMPDVIDYIELSRDFSIVELTAPEAFVGRTLKQLELRPRFGLTLIAIKRRTEAARDAPVVTNVPAAVASARSQSASSSSIFTPSRMARSRWASHSASATAIAR